MASTPPPASRHDPRVDDDIEIRRADASDLPAVLALAQASLKWRPDDPNDRFFRWKHFENPAGASPMWVAFAGGRLAGFRTFLRWRFRAGDGRLAMAVRAVDTATHPDFRGQGIFSRLTLGALDELRDEGVDFVFNTPNDQSRPGYLKMQWQVVGRVPIRMRPLHVSSLARTLRSRVPATKWSIDTEVGVPAVHALADDQALDDLLATLAAAHPPRRGDAPHERLVTDRTPAHLRWRYRFAPLHYRAVVAPGGLAEGVAIFRLRRRGQAVEAVLCELLAPRGGRRLVGQIAASSGADYVLAAGAPIRGARLLRMPRQGPILTWRQVAPDARQPRLSAWELTMGDLELM